VAIHWGATAVAVAAAAAISKGLDFLVMELLLVSPVAPLLLSATATAGAGAAAAAAGGAAAAGFLLERPIAMKGLTIEAVLAALAAASATAAATLDLTLLGAADLAALPRLKDLEAAGVAMPLGVFRFKVKNARPLHRHKKGRTVKHVHRWMSCSFLCNLKLCKEWFWCM
jgi:hypothetical protein